MARDGNGIYSLAPLNPVVPNTEILAEWANDSLADVRDAITASIAKDGQTVPTADLPMGTFKHTNCGNATARNQYATLAQVQQDATRHLGIVTSPDSVSLFGTTTPTFPALTEGMVLTFRKDYTTNGGNVAMYINGLGGVPLVRPDGNPLQGGDLPAGSFVMVQYTFGVLVLMNQPKLLPTGPGSGLNADLLDGLDSTFFARNANPAFTGSGSISGNFTISGTAYSNTPGYGDNSVALANTNHVLTALNVRLGTINGIPILMHANVAPPGWTRWNTVDNYALRVTAGNMTSGGSVLFTNAFAYRTSDPTALSEAQLPPHNHGPTITGSSSATFAAGNTVATGWSAVNVGSGAGHAHTLNMAVAYIDVGFFTKD